MSRSADRAAEAAARVGLLGGTFDPLHQGHLRMALAAERACHLERIYFVPAAYPWHKAAPAVDYPDRYAMVALALAGRPRWMPLHIPSAASATYAVDQLIWMRKHHRRERVYFIIGADAFATLPTWKQYRRLLTLCDFVVMARSGFGLEEMIAVLPRNLVRAVESTGVRLVGGRRLHWLPNFSSSASSTSARNWLANQAEPSRAGLVPAAVSEYARRAGLYRYAKNH